MRRRAAIPLAILLLAPPAGAEDLQAVVTTPDGDPVRDAVVYALPLGADGRPLPNAGPIDIDQIDKEYVPYVTAVRVGTQVRFPNHDQIRHHVYSFSEAKTFEIPLYKGTPPEPILFDKPGVVALGCNIHDWMAAYVFVTEAPFFGVTGEDGRVALTGLSARDYKVGVWHPRQEGDANAGVRTVTVSPAAAPVQFAIEQRRVWRPRRAPGGGGGGNYR
jgi:plastocyanin